MVAHNKLMTDDDPPIPPLRTRQRSLWGDVLGALGAAVAYCVLMAMVLLMCAAIAAAVGMLAAVCVRSYWWFAGVMS